MAIPFNLPDEEEESPSPAQNSTPNAQSTPIPIPQNNNNNSPTPQLPQIDNEALVQAFYEALCRCSQGWYFFTFFYSCLAVQRKLRDKKNVFVIS